MSAPVEFSASMKGLDVIAQQWTSYADALNQVIGVESQVSASESKMAAAMAQTAAAGQGAAQGLTAYGGALTTVQGASDQAANSITKFGSVFAGAGTSAQGATAGVTEFSGALANVSTELQTTNADIGQYNTLAGKVSQTNSQIASSAQGVAQSQHAMSAGFKESIVGLGLATSGIVGIVGQYTQLERSQLLVARSSLTLEKSQNTLIAMQLKYQAAVAKGTLTSEQQALAQAKLAAQQDAVGLAQDRLNINTARLAETQANFAANIIPSIIQAATGIIGAFESMSVAFKAAGTTGFFAAAGIRAAMIATGVGAAVAIGTIAIQAWTSSMDAAQSKAEEVGPSLEGVGESSKVMADLLKASTGDAAGGVTVATKKMTGDIDKLSQIIPADLQHIITETAGFKTKLMANLTPEPAQVAKITAPIKEDPTLKAIMSGHAEQAAGLTFGGGGEGGPGGIIKGWADDIHAALPDLEKALDPSIFKMSDSLQIFLGMGPTVTKTFNDIAKGAADAGEPVLTFAESIDAMSQNMPTVLALGKGMAADFFGITNASDSLAISIAQSTLRISELTSQKQYIDAFKESANLSELIANFQMFGANADQIIAKSTEMGAAGVSLAENIQGVADSYTRVNPLITNMVNAQVEEANITKASEASWSKYLQTIGVKVPQGLKLTSDQMLELAVAQKTLGESAGVMAQIHAEAFSSIHEDYSQLLNDVAEGGKKAKEAFKGIDWKFIPPGLKKEIQDMVKDDAALVKQTQSLQQAMMLLDRQMDIGALTAKGRAQWAAELSRDLGKLATTAPQLKGAFDPIIEFLATDQSAAGLRKVVAFIETEFVPAMKDGAIDTNEAVDLQAKAIATFGELDPSIQVPSWDKLKKALDDTGKSGQILIDMDIGKAVSKSITPLTNLQIGQTVSDQFAKIVGAGATDITVPTPEVAAPVVPAPVKAADFDTKVAAIQKSIETITGTGTGAVAPKPLVLPPPDTATFISGLLDADNAMLLYIQSLGVLATTPLTLPAPITDAFIAGMGLAAISIDALNSAMGLMSTIPLILPAPNIDNFTTGIALIFAQLVTISEAFDLLAKTPLVIPAPNVDQFTKTFELLALIPGAFVDLFNQAMGGGGGAGGGGGKKKKKGGGGGSGLVIPAPDTAGFIEGMGVAALSIDALSGAMGVMSTTPMVIPAPNTDAFTQAFELLIQVPALFIEAFNEAMGSGGGGGGKKKKKKGKGGGGSGLIIPAPDSTQFVQGMTDALQVVVDFTSTFLEIMGVVVEGFSAGGQAAEEFSGVVDGAMSNADSAASSAASSIEGSMSTIADSAASAQDAVEQLGSAINGLPSSKNITIHVGISGPGVKYLAEGFHGIIDKPTLLIVGEAGPERVDVGQAGGKASGLFMDRNLNVNPIMSSSEKTGIMGPRQQEKDALVQILSRKKKMDRDDIKELVEAMIDRMRGRIDASKRGAAGDMSREIKKFIIPVQLNWGKDVVMREIREGFLQD
jgi:hypothetical protein